MFLDIFGVNFGGLVVLFGTKVSDFLKHQSRLVKRCFREYPSTGNLSSCFFYSGGVNFLLQLQFLAPVELFFKQLNGYSF